jgi:hypothetical protein
MMGEDKGEVLKTWLESEEVALDEDQRTGLARGEMDGLRKQEEHVRWM